MSQHELLIARIRGEYRDMPGLRLTLPQACRLWQVDTATCKGVLQMLVEERFLVCREDGSLIALPTQLKAINAGLPPGQRRRAG